MRLAREHLAAAAVVLVAVVLAWRLRRKRENWEFDKPGIGTISEKHKSQIRKLCGGQALTWTQIKSNDKYKYLSKYKQGAAWAICRGAQQKIIKTKSPETVLQEGKQKGQCARICRSRAVRIRRPCATKDRKMCCKVGMKDCVSIEDTQDMRWTELVKEGKDGQEVIANVEKAKKRYAAEPAPID